MDQFNQTLSTNKIIKALSDAILRLKLPDTRILLTPVRNPKFGNFSTNIAMILASRLGKDATILAKEIAASINKEEFDIKEVRVEPPGFINFYIDINFFGNEINLVLKRGSGWVKTDDVKGSVIIEYLSSNPTGFLHVGHARNAVVGSVLVRVFKLAGFKVVSDFYINDYGNQIDQLADSVSKRYQQLIDSSFVVEDITYGGNDIIECAKEFANHKKTSEEKDGQKNDDIRAFSVDFFLKQAVKDAEILGANFDIFTSESRLYQTGKVDKAFQELRDTDQLIQEGEAYLLRSSQEDDDKDRVIRRSDGRYTYLLPDLAYHRQKLTRFGDLKLALNIFGSDHIGYIKRLVYGLNVLGCDAKKLNFLVIQQVRLLRDGQEFKMSKRAGNSVWLRELVELIGRDYAIFSLLNRSVSSTIDIDVSRLQTRDLKNPTYAIQYSYARAKQLLVRGGRNTYSFSGNDNKHANQLIKLILEWPEVIQGVVRTLKPELVGSYCLRLSQQFNSFYSQVKVIGSENEGDLLAVVKAFEIVMAQVMETIGIRIFDGIDP